MRTYFFIPPLKKVSGGMSVIAQIATHLSQAFYEVYLTGTEKIPHDLSGGLPTIRLADITFQHDDRYVAPEGWPAYLAPGLKARANCAVYAQSWAFLLGILPENASWDSLPVKIFSVSRPVSIFIKETTGFIAPIVSPAIDPHIFYPLCENEKSFFQKEKLRVAWMPRKNRRLGEQIKAIFEAFLTRAGLALPEWIMIDNMSPAQVGETLRNCQIFLSTGFPEGFSLPPLEAMACGCVTVGFTGLGGWEYMRQAWFNGYDNPFGCFDKPWGANGFFVSDGDVWGAALALKAAYQSLRSGEALKIREEAFKTAGYYSPERQREEILKLWADKDFWKGY